MRTLSLIAVAVVLFGVSLARAAEANEAVIAAARTFADGGGYRTDWKGTGTPVEVRHKEAVILKQGEGGTYCSGFTFATAMRVLTDSGRLAEKSVDEIRAFQKAWYGVTKAHAERQCATALELLGVGREVTAADAKPGDFVQFWRVPKGGHSAVFLGWVEEDGRRVGFRYRSSQGSTDGVGDKVERFSTAGGKVDANRIYFGRIETPAGK